MPARQTHLRSGPPSIPAAVNHASSVFFTQFATGMVRMCLLLPMRPTIAQRSSRRCKLSSVSSANSWRRRPQPNRMARVALSRFSVRVCPSDTCRSAVSRHCKPVAQTRARLRTPLTRWMPATNSFGLAPGTIYERMAVQRLDYEAADPGFVASFRLAITGRSRECAFTRG